MIDSRKLLLMLIITIVHCQRPNSCHNFVDYYTMNPTNCWYNPEINMKTPEIIKHNGYPLETYETATEDGYLLTVFRMPKENPKGVIFLQHPVTSSSICFIDKGKKRSLGFLLWDNGYDVWLGNFRGTYDSRKHMFLDPNKYKYWNFSFHEHGIYDITSQIDLVANKTNAKPASITFIGHSMGSTAGAVYAAEKVEHSKKWLKVMILMASTTNMVHTLPILKLISPYVNYVMALAEDLQVVEVLAFNKYILSFLSICRNAPTMILCLILQASFNRDVIEEIPPDIYPIMLSHNPAGMSLKSLIHYGQLDANGGDFTMYDYGKEKNLEYYHTETPTLYHIENIAIPLFSIVGDRDSLANPRDVAIFYSKLPEIAKKYGILMIKDMSHVEFVYGVNSHNKIYIPIVHFLDKIYADGGEK